MKEGLDILYPRRWLKNNCMKDKYKKKIIRIVSIGALILIACVLVIIFVSKDIDMQVKKVEALRTQALLDQSFLKAYNLLVGQKKDIVADSDILKGLLPAPDDLISVQARIQDLGKASQVLTAISFDVLNPASGNEPANQSFRLSLTGNLPNIKQFLANLSALPYFIQLDSFNINRQNEGMPGYITAGTYLMNANGKIYVNDKNAN